MAHSLIRACPRDELLAALRTLLRLLRAPARHAETAFLALELLPAFTTIRAGELRNLPQAIADRITACGRAQPSGLGLQPAAASRFGPADALLIVPASGLVVLAALV